MPAKKLTIKLNLELIEQGSSNNFGAPNKRNIVDLISALESGTDPGDIDRCYSYSGSFSGILDIDLLGSLVDAFGAAVTFPKVAGIFIRNRSTTTGYTLVVGGDASPAFAGLFGAGTHTIKVQPGGYFLWFAPNADCLIPAATTNDTLQLDAGANTLSVDLAIFGRSA